MSEWKKEAQDLFFDKKLSINEISLRLLKSRKCISGYLKTLPGYIEKKESGKLKNQNMRKDYKRNWDKTKRVRKYNIDYLMLKRQHDIDVQVLSHDRF